VGGTNLLFTMAALLIIDHFGRRRLMLVGSIGYILSLGSTAWAFYTYGDAFAAVVKATTPGRRFRGRHRRRSPQYRRAVGLLVFIAFARLRPGA